jgi:uncharacterized protein (TIGR02117 family)
MVYRPLLVAALRDPSPAGTTLRRSGACLVISFLAFHLAGCGALKGGRHELTLDGQEVVLRSQSAHVIYVTGHGWHTGLVLRTNDIPASVVPEVLDFQGTDFIEFGWGDEGVYRAKKITPGLVAKAALIPTPSVLHLAGFQGRVEEFFTASDLVELTLDDAQFALLCEHISATFDRGESVPSNLGVGLYGQSRFYRAKGSYYFPKTCNVWTAGALKASGFPANTVTAMTAEGVLKQSRRFGRNVQASSDWIKQAALGGEPDAESFRY